MTDTSGFYKIDDDNVYRYAPNRVHTPSGSLYRQLKDEYTYPVFGWIWYDTKEDAIASGSVTYDTTYSWEDESEISPDVRQKIILFKVKNIVDQINPALIPNIVEKYIDLLEFRVVKLQKWVEYLSYSGSIPPHEQ